MKIKTSELSEAALNWAVGKIEGYFQSIPLFLLEAILDGDYSPSTDWAQGGPIIEREKVILLAPSGDIDYWYAGTQYGGEIDGEWVLLDNSIGETPLIAAMRCYVALKLGEEVEIPDELINSVNEVLS